MVGSSDARPNRSIPPHPAFPNDPAMDPFPLDPQRHDYPHYLTKHPLKKFFTSGDVERVLFRFLWERFNNKVYWGMTVEEYTTEMRDRLDDDRIKRQTLNPALKFAIDCGMIMFSPQRHVVLQNLMQQVPNAGEVTVVDVPDDPAGFHVAQAGAEVVLSLMRKIQSRKEGPIHIGLAPGEKSERLVRALAGLLRLYPDAPHLVVHALTPPHAVWRPDQTPLAWLGLLKGTLCDEVEFVNLPAEPVCASGARLEDSRCEEVREARARVDELDIVITSMAGSGDLHGHLRRHLARPDFRTPAAELERGAWVGEVLLQPYGRSGPIRTSRGLRPVTLLDLQDLARIAGTKGKYVILLCGPCMGCGAPKTEALRPLLEAPSLNIWTHLVVDYRNARSVTRGEGVGSGSGGAEEGGRGRAGEALLA
jgi:hypothetical protein